MSNQIKVLISAEIPELFEDLDLLRSITQYLDWTNCYCNDR